MYKEIKRWRVRRESALVLDIIHGMTMVSELSRQYLAASAIEVWCDHAKVGMETR